MTLTLLKNWITLKNLFKCWVPDNSKAKEVPILLDPLVLFIFFFFVSRRSETTKTSTDHSTDASWQVCVAFSGGVRVSGSPQHRPNSPTMWPILQIFLCTKNMPEHSTLEMKIGLLSCHPLQRLIFYLDTILVQKDLLSRYPSINRVKIILLENQNLLNQAYMGFCK